MIAPMIAVLCLAAPCGYLVGDVFSHKNRKDDWIKYASAALLPLAAILAIVLITQTEMEQDQ